MRIWLDDVRPAPPGWTWLKTVSDVISTIQAGGVLEVSLDYDLDYTDPRRTGDEVAVWIAQQAALGFPMPVVHTHSANPVGAAKMAFIRQRSEHETGYWEQHVCRTLATVS